MLILLGNSVTAAFDNNEQAEIYRDLRGQALSLNTETIKSRDGVLALLMETGYNDAAATILAAADGSVSLYLSNGGGVIGAGEYEQVREIVFETLSEVGNFTDELERTATYPLPEFGRVRFYLVTDHGVYTAEASKDSLGNGKHKLSPLFNQVQKLIAYMRAAEEHRRGQEAD